MNMEVNVYMPYYIISIHEKELWNKYIQNSVMYDFYHTWYYNSLEKAGNPFLFVFQFQDDFIALPLIKREIEGSAFYDCTSVYGYAGPISSLPFEDLNGKIIQDFKEAFSNFLNNENIVSVFSRLHPIINQELLLERLGGIFDNGKTVAIDLQLPLEEQKLRYRRAIRQKVNQLARKGFEVKEASTKEEIIEFVKIYNENMIKVNASSYYFFDDQYFFDLLNSDDFESKLLLAYYDGEITSGGIVTLSNNIMQFHLAATRNEFLPDAPMKLLFHEAAVLGKSLGMSYLHLGGGVGGKEDSLFEFKSGFSDLHLSFKTWRYIANLSAYNSLVEERCKDKEAANNRFPLYRC
ncbi:GNAT family N-acetyltransferase [Rubrolithibacter danxiaensis]|uniref:GNAT family N-acetyltransferase n=1 Tax=Rubrolithibacter danxiaensis TaxID=3390805 RepID=UPI003BF7F056